MKTLIILMIVLSFSTVLYSQQDKELRTVYYVEDQAYYDTKDSVYITQPISGIQISIVIFKDTLNCRLYINRDNVETTHDYMIINKQQQEKYMIYRLKSPFGKPILFIYGENKFFIFYNQYFEILSNEEIFKYVYKGRLISKPE